MNSSRLVSRAAAALLGVGLVASAAWVARHRERDRDRGPRPDRNRPVALYARVVDDAGRPLPGAAADMWVGRLEPLDAPDTRIPAADRMASVRRTADAAGAFAVEGYRGYVLNVVRVAAPGHLLSPWAKRGYLFVDVPAMHRPDPAAPVLFRQWRRRHPADPAGEPIHARGNCRLAFDGPPVAFDLTTGGPPPADRPTGDVRLRAVAHARRAGPNGRVVVDDWSVVAEGIGSELAEPRPDDEFMFEPPVGGYALSAAARRRPGDRGPLQSALFVRGRGGRLRGIVNLEANRLSDDADHHPNLSLETHVRTNGSTNLEFDYWRPADPDAATTEALTLRFRGPPRPAGPAAAAAGPAEGPIGGASGGPPAHSP